MRKLLFLVVLAVASTAVVEAKPKVVKLHVPKNRKSKVKAHKAPKPQRRAK